MTIDQFFAKWGSEGHRLLINELAEKSTASEEHKALCIEMLDDLGSLREPGWFRCEVCGITVFAPPGTPHLCSDHRQSHQETSP